MPFDDTDYNMISEHLEKVGNKLHKISENLEELNEIGWLLLNEQQLVRCNMLCSEDKDHIEGCAFFEG